MRLRLLRRFATRIRSDVDGPYVCTLCRATFEEGRVICPKCRAFVVPQDDD